MSPAYGTIPSAQVPVQKLCTVLNFPRGPILYTVPASTVPPPSVVPYKLPSLACTRSACGVLPSRQFGCAQKLCTVVSLFGGVKRKTTPHPREHAWLFPPNAVVP